MESTHNDTLNKLYQDKRRDYYDAERPEMMQLIPSSCRRLLDVGCGSGSFAAAVGKYLNSETWGVEPDPLSAAQAALRLNHVQNTTLEDAKSLPRNYFDCIIFNDVLEHLLTPNSALLLASELLANNGCVVASIPNVSCFPTIWKLIMRGEWTYEERGILDKTHLRFYTRNSIIELFSTAGFDTALIKGINPFCNMSPGDQRIWRYYNPLRLIRRNSIVDMRYLQFAIRAVKRNTARPIPTLHSTN